MLQRLWACGIGYCNAAGFLAPVLEGMEAVIHIPDNIPAIRLKHAEHTAFFPDTGLKRSGKLLRIHFCDLL